MRYVISYDLVGEDRDYQLLWDFLEGIEAKRILWSQWIVRLNEIDSVELLNDLRVFTRSEDRLFIICLDNEDWASINPMVDPNTI